MDCGTAKIDERKMRNISGIQAFIKGRCPQCRTGEVFKGPIFSKNYKNVHKNCPHCQVKYEQEPGFFWGAMYFSYSLIVGLLIILSILMFTFFDDPSLLLLSVVIIGITVPLTPLFMRISRLMLMYMAGPYKTYLPELRK
ncbi:MAG: hypothetical protein ACI9JN_000196 [Bacteroidia bacterium]